MAGSTTLTVIIVDQNDNSPTIPLPQEIRIPESRSFIRMIFSFVLLASTLNYRISVAKQTPLGNVVVQLTCVFLFTLLVRYVDWHRDYSCDG